MGLFPYFRTIFVLLDPALSSYTILETYSICVIPNIRCIDCMARHTETQRLKWALIISSVYFFAELIAGFLTNSLALLSDAGHMLSDIGALGLSIFAFRIAKRPATHHSTYGYHRVEILAALFNGLTLWLIVGVIFASAYNRLFNPPAVRKLRHDRRCGLRAVGQYCRGGDSPRRPSSPNLNMRGAFLHVLSDAVGSVGAIAAGVIMLATGWYLADPLISIFIGALILFSSWSLVKDSLERAHAVGAQGHSSR